MKATFTTTLLSQVGTVNISNMSVRSEELLNATGCVEDGSWLAQKAAELEDLSAWKVTRFETTPQVSPQYMLYGLKHVLMRSSTDVDILGRLCERPVQVQRGVIRESEWATEAVAHLW